MEPEQQVEIQLGHLCNNRCVFCVSGQRTAMGEAHPVAADPVVAKLEEARARGIDKVTLLGGEPTLQPEFLAIVRRAVALGYREIVVFTNGVKTARASFVDEILATGGNFTFRLSFQGATARAHERTTKKLGSFGRLVESLANLHARRQRITVNMCVVRSNQDSVEAFPALLLPYGVSQLHLDMVRPLDAGVRTEAELREMMPRYSDLVPALERMIAGFPPGFDVNLGNLPYCVAQHLAEHIHHDGEKTYTVAVDHDDALSEPWDKYETKRRDKRKPASCSDCVYEPRCSGVFETYERFYGVSELVPVRTLPVVDPGLASLRELAGRAADARIGAGLLRLHGAGPFAELTVRGARLREDGQAAAIDLEHTSGVRVRLAFAVQGARLAGRYALDRPAPSLSGPGLTAGVRAAMTALLAE